MIFPAELLASPASLLRLTTPRGPQKGGTASPLGWAPCRPASAAPASAPPWSGTPSWPGWSAVTPTMTGPGPGSSTSVAAPAGSRSGWPGTATGHRRRPQSRRARGPRPPRRRGRRRGWSPVSRAISPTSARTCHPAPPTWCSATGCSRWSPTRRPRCARSPRCSARGRPAQPARRPAARRRRRPRDGRPLPAGARPARDRPDDPASGRGGRRYTADEVAALLADAGFTLEATHAVRVFADLVPGSLLDLEPGATAALVDLERAVADRPEYLPLATQVHLLATR